MAFNSYMHERNIYKTKPNFAQIALDFPNFRKFAIRDARGKVRVDFTNPDALRMLTEILLQKDFSLTVTIPQGFLVPTVPQRLNYILWIEDLLVQNFLTENVTGIDIGTGPCAIFSMLGAQKNGWKFIATESSLEAIDWAMKNIEKNYLENKINVLKVSPDSVFEDVLHSSLVCYDFCLCNPPFFENIEEIRKKHHSTAKTIADVAQKDEIFVEGGEIKFVKKLLDESLLYKNRIRIFTSMFGKKKSFLQILKEIKDINDIKYATTEFCQGNTIRWGIAWTFNQSITFKEIQKKIKPKKPKPALEYQIPLQMSKKFELKSMIGDVKAILETLEIPFTTSKLSKNFAELLLKSDKNTWIHQRRKRRQLQKQQPATSKSDENLSSNVALSSNETVFKLESNIESGDILHKNNQDDTKVECIEFIDDNHKSDSPVNVVIDSSETVANTIISETGVCNHEENKITHLEVDELEKSEISVNNEISLSTHVKSTLSNSQSPIDSNIVSTTGENSSCNDIKSSNITDNDNAMEYNIMNSIADQPESSVNHKRKNEPIDELGFENKRIKIDSADDNDSVNQGTVLHCYLQLIQGKKKVYVKMNCPETADRNTMYQVFQLIKNKLK